MSYFYVDLSLCYNSFQADFHMKKSSIAQRIPVTRFWQCNKACQDRKPKQKDEYNGALSSSSHLVETYCLYNTLYISVI